MTDRPAVLDAALDLYGVPGPEFVARRTAAARGARRAGAPAEVVAAVGRLPRPAPAAEALNRLLREDPGALADALRVGAALRDAHGAGSPGDVRAAGERLRAAAGEAARRAAARLAAEGRGSPTLVARLEDTVRAAAVDPAAAAAVVSGLLLRPLVSTGLEPVELDGAVAVPAAPPLDGVPAVPTGGEDGRGVLTLVPGGRRETGPAPDRAGSGRTGRAREVGGARGQGDGGAVARTRGRPEGRGAGRTGERRAAAEADADRRAAARRGAIVDLDEAGRLASEALDRTARAESALHAAQEGAAGTREELERTASEAARLTERLRQLRDERVAADRAVRRARGEYEAAVTGSTAAVARRDAARRRLDDLGTGPA